MKNDDSFKEVSKEMITRYALIAKHLEAAIYSIFLSDGSFDLERTPEMIRYTKLTVAENLLKEIHADFSGWKARLEEVSK